MTENEMRAGSAQERKNRIRKRYGGQGDNSIEIIPGMPVSNIYDDEGFKRVAVYARVSTDDENQTSSYELQKSYYEEMVKKYPNWELIGIYADEGISGTSLLHRDEFKRLISDCESGKIDLIVTKNVSRFARNVVDCIQCTRELKAHRPPVGILFETENIYTLNENSEMQLSFLSTLAQEESHAKSQSMNHSYRMRFERGIFLNPTLLGFDRDDDDNLIINEDEAKTVRLIFLLYMCGKSSTEIAQILTQLKRKTKRGRTEWATGSIMTILRNEKYCGDFLAQKTYTPSYLNHKVVRNNNERPKYYKKDHHDAIVTREEYILVQNMIGQAKYQYTRVFPELRVIATGILKGFVQFNPCWLGFKADDYLDACHSVLEDSDYLNPLVVVRRKKGDIDYRNYQVTREQFVPTTAKISVYMSQNTMRFSAFALQTMENTPYVEILYHPFYEILVVRKGQKTDKHAIKWSVFDGNKYRPVKMKATGITSIIYELSNWNKENKYLLTGYAKTQGDETVLMFYVDEPEIRISTEHEKDLEAFPSKWQGGFGDYYYEYIAKSQSIFDPEKTWETNTEGIISNPPDFLEKNEKSINEEICNLVQEMRKNMEDHDGQ